MTSNSAKRERSDARRNRERILDAARAAFAADGTGLEMRAIAEAAGVGIGTVFRNFPTKQQLVSAMAHEWATQRDATLGRSLSITDPWGAVADHVRWCGEMMSREPGLRRLLMDESVKSQLSDEEDTAFAAGLAELVARAQAAQVLRTEVTTATYYGLLVGLAAAINAGSAWQIAADVILSGLRRPKDAPQVDNGAST
ncbi:TetR/AcrR family transcriptional regulator [Nocardia iowensis]|uniref:TetR/AcrR family transcriptional regulator n=1 Tax=Nocardia iowensis TaxID=204891 RepID=A0ABX8RF05_NOCIO|nr:TetR/AcrR family transcriptional regulator [Nocardia iowensis]QXN88180.1 TetR/AcrR family transcriptional regulator [Nocardia iowensis]